MIAAHAIVRRGSGRFNRLRLDRLRLDRVQLGCALLAAGVAALLIRFGPAPGDAAVHLYRTFLVSHGAVVWDNFWYSGDYPLAGYSLLYYLPAALFGNLPMVFAATVASAVLFAMITRAEWGSAAIWPNRVFAVCAAAPLFTGEYSYAFGLATMLGAVRALQSRRSGVAILLAALTLGFSPLAFAFLCLVLGSVLATRRRLTLSAATVVVAIASLAGLELVITRLFPSNGFYPFHVINLISIVGVSTLGVLLARRSPHGKLLISFFALWAAGGLVASLVRSPLGDNWARLDEVIFPVMLLAAFLAKFRPRKLVVLALAGAFAYNITPYLLLIPYRLDNLPATAAYWRVPVDFLHAHAQPGFRVEVVPTAAHWESYWIPRAGFPLARGFYRQLDIVDNKALYANHLEPAAYQRWLRTSAVEYVLLPSTQLDFVAATQEAKLLRSGHSGLVVAERTHDWTIYRLPHPTPMLTGPAPARVDAFGHTTIGAVISAPGRYLLRVHYAPIWKTRGDVCVSQAPGGMTYLDVYARGSIRLTVLPAGEAVVRAADGAESCKTPAAS